MSYWPLGWLVLLERASQAVGRNLGRRLWPSPRMSWAASQCWAVTQNPGIQSWGLSRDLGHNPHSLNPGVSLWCSFSEGSKVAYRPFCYQRVRSLSSWALARPVQSKIVPFHRGQSEALLVPAALFFFVVFVIFIYFECFA